MPSHACWLVKQEPTAYSWDQFVKDGVTAWTGVRNFQARNNLLAMREGDRVLFYHSVVGKEIVGVARVKKVAYPDPTAAEGNWVCVDLVPEAVTAAERLARAARTCGLSWEASVALGATERLMAAADDTRAAADVAAVRARLGGDGAPAPVSAPTGILYVPWLEQRFARPVPGARCQLLAQGWPREWLGANLEVHGLPAGPRSTIGYALRWHGDRPAVLWQVDGDPVGLFGGVDAHEIS